MTRASLRLQLIETAPYRHRDHWPYTVSEEGSGTKTTKSLITR